MEAHRPPAVEGVGGAVSAWDADECDRASGQELPPEEGRQHAELVQQPKNRELDAWGKFDVYESRAIGNVSKQVVHTRWVLTWKMADGQKSVEARLAAKGYQDPDLKDGLVDTSWRISRRSSHLQVISLCSIKKWKLWGLDAENALSQADGYYRDVFIRAPAEWGPMCGDRVWKRRASLRFERRAGGLFSLIEAARPEFRRREESLGCTMPGALL